MNFFQSYKNHIHLHFIVFIWGFTAILGKVISLPAGHLVWYRMLIAFLGIGFFMLFKRQNFTLSKANFLKIFGTSLIVAIHWVTFFQAVKVSNISITLAVLSSTAFFVSLIDPIFSKRKIIIYELLLGLAVIGGLYLIFSFESQYTLGILLSLISAICAALFGVINSKLVKTVSASSISFYEMFGGFLGITIYFLCLEKFNSSFFEVPISDIFYLLILGLVCTSYPFLASVAIMKKLSAFTVALSINMEPVYGIVLAFFLFPKSETMSLEFYIGAILIMGIILLNAYLKNKGKKPEEKKITFEQM